jgi:hypothetical protein
VLDLHTELYNQSLAPHSVSFSLIYHHLHVRGASKIKLKKVNKKRMVTVRRLIIFLNISRHPFADLFTMLSSSVQNSEGRGNGNGGNSFADPCQEFKEGFFGVSSGLPFV